MIRNKMPSPLRCAARRAAPGVSLVVLALTLLGGCSAVGSYEAGMPPGVNFAGTWRLNAAQSDDPRKALEKLRPRRSSPAPVVVQNGRRRRGQGPGQGSGQSAQEAGALPEEPLEAPLPRSAFSFVPNADLLRNEVLSIQQRPDAFVVDDGISVRRLTPGQRSVVSVPGGVGDQSTGWKGKDYVVEVRSQLGLQMRETYSLSNKNGRQLIIHIHLSGSGLPTLNLTRVYDPAGSETPRSLPSID